MCLRRNIEKKAEEGKGEKRVERENGDGKKRQKEKGKEEKGERMWK